MPSSTRTRWILFALLPLAALMLGLHLREVVRTGIALPPVYAVPGDGEDAYPLVGGEMIEVRGQHTLEVGDRLIRVGGIDLAGAGYLGFMGAAFEAAGATGRTTLVAERAGERFETTLQLTPHPVPWMRVPFLAMMLGLVTLVLLQRPDDPFIQWMAVTFASVVIGESIFEGGGVTQTVVAKTLFIFGGLVWWPLVIMFAAYLPGDPTREVRVPGVPWLGALAALLWTLPKSMYLLGGPAPSEAIPAIVSAADALTIVVLAGVFATNYRRSLLPVRRRVRWVIFSGWAAGLSMFAALSIPVIAPGFAFYSEAVAVAAVVASIIPIGATIAVLGYDLFDIDRLISATATVTVLLAGFLAVLFAMVPPVSDALAAATGSEPGAARLLLSMAAAAGAVSLNGWLRPKMDAVFFPGRVHIERGVRAMIADQRLASDARSLAQTLAEGIHEIFEPRFTAVFAADDAGGYEPFRQLGDAVELGPADGDFPLIRELAESGGAVLAGDESGASHAAERAWRSRCPAVLFLPLRDGEALAAFVAMGAKRSGDVVRPTESELLGAVLEAASRQLQLLREAEAHARERVRSESLASAQLARSRHLAAASHDLRQPLHAMQLFSETLSARAPDDATRELAGRIRETATSVHEMFDGLIDMSRLEQGRIEPEIGEVAVRPLLERLAAEAQPLAEREGLRLDVAAADAAVESDPLLLARIVRNLLTNALRYTRKGQVTLRAERDGDRLRIQVADTGPGIPDDMRDAIFEEFVRLDGSTNTRGLGLGLSIVRGLAERLGHPLRLESQQGVGTTFTVELPLVHERTAESASTTDDGELTGRTLLVVDDDLELLEAMHGLLESWGARVLLASDEDEALDAQRRRGPIDAVLADYHLADARGTDVVAALRAAAGSDLPAWIITAADPEELDTTLPVLPKPLSVDRLRAALMGLGD